MADDPSEWLAADAVAGNGKTHMLLLAGIAAIGLAITLILATSVLETVRQTKYAEMQSRVADLVGRVETEFKVQMASLYAIRALMDTQEVVTREEFTAYAANLRTVDAGIVAYGWAPRLNMPDAVPGQPADTGTMIPVELLQPPTRVQSLLGLDLLEDAYIREALHSSIDHDEIRISEPLSLGSSEGKNAHARSFALAMYPLYVQGKANFMIEQRRQNARGVVFAVLDIRDTIGFVIDTSSFSEAMAAGHLGIEVVDQGNAGVGVPIYRAGDFAGLVKVGENGLLNKTLTSERNLRIAQRNLKIRFAVDAAGLGNAPYFAASLVLTIGLILTLAALAYAWSRMNYEKRVGEMVRERTKALRESEERLQDMADVSADWFWEMDSELRFTYLSERFEQVTGLSRQTFLGRTRAEAAGVRSFDTDPLWRRHLEDIQARKPFHDFRYNVQHAGGNEEYFSISGKPVFGEDGSFRGYRGTGRDVTDEEAQQRRLRDSEARLHRNVQQLEMSRQDLEESTAKMAEMAERYAIEKDRAEASERSKSEFLASMSHEIRTPMTGVMGFADMLLDSNLAPEDREKVIKIKGATQSLLTIINDILDLSKLDAGRLSIEQLDFNIKTTVEEVLDLVRERARFKKLALNVDFQPGMEIGMHGDPTRFRQILINLVGNAVKFTHAGSVTIKARLSGAEPVQTIEFRVIDTGIGISEENRKKLFSDFSQADASISRHYEGTGLGLSISKRLVELMGGKIWVESKEGEGSEFCFTLPFRKAASDVTNMARQHLAEHYKTTRPLHILVAEDNKLNQRIIVATLDKFGHEASVVENGEQAVNQVDKGDYDLILMDIRMPEMSGPDATRVIRARPDALAKIPIIALTADAMEEHIRGYIEAGMNACVTKPIDRSALVLTINEVLGEDVHVPLSEAELARVGYALPTDEDAQAGATGEQAEVISVADFLSQLEDVASEIERDKKAKP